MQNCKKCAKPCKIVQNVQSCGQALAGSRDFKSAKIPGFFRLKSQNCSGFFVTMFWTPWNALKPKIAEIAKKSFHFFSFTLFIDGKRTKHKDKYKIQKKSI